MLKNTVRLGSVAGIEIGVHYSWLIIFALVTWSLAGGFFPVVYAEMTDGAVLPATTAWLLAVVSALLLFASVLVHELAHSLVARARGLEVHSITLFLFGGVSNLAAESKSPGTEFLIAVVGPLTSIGLGAVAFLASGLVPALEAQLVLGYLAFINLLLGLFNLIPGYPLDGGRVLRSIVWKVTNSIRRATEIAAAAGQLVGIGFIVLGVSTLLLPPGGDALSGLWIAAVGWFLQGAAGASLQQVIVEARLRDVRVGDVIRPDRAGVAPDTTVADLIEELLRHNRRAIPVVEGARLVGLVTIGDVSRVPREARDRTRVAEVMAPRDRLAVVSPADPLTTALERLAAGDYEQLPVVSDGRLDGMLTRADVVRQVQLREALGVEPDR